MSAPDDIQNSTIATSGKGGAENDWLNDVILLQSMTVVTWILLYFLQFPHTKRANVELLSFLRNPFHQKTAVGFGGTCSHVHIYSASFVCNWRWTDLKNSQSRAICACHAWSCRGNIQTSNTEHRTPSRWLRKRQRWFCHAKERLYLFSGNFTTHKHHLPKLCHMIIHYQTTLWCW